MEETKTEGNEGKKADITEIALPALKIGMMERVPFFAFAIPFAAWTFLRYWKGGFPPAQAGLYLLFLAAVLVGETFVCSPFVSYDHDKRELRAGEFLLRRFDDVASVARLTKATVHTVEIKERKVPIGGFSRRFVRGTYTVWRIEQEKEEGAEAEPDTISLWLSKKEDAEKFDALFSQALAEAGRSDLAVERHAEPIDWKEYAKLHPGNGAE